ncbi:MAG: TonB-dependent receptor [Bryobacteraceae bacterium]|nr:TonB-dependent receptor [Bryobacteraceae bacterium]
MSTRLALLIVSVAAPLAAQNATISGFVSDASAAALVGSTLTLTQLSTGVSQSTATNDSGLYLFAAVGPGQYRLNCTAPGFSSKEIANLTVEVGQAIRFDFQLQLGATSERIEVSASAGLIQTESTEIGQVIDGRRIIDMPLNGRNYLELAQLSVGVIPAGQVGRGNRTASEGGFLSMGIQPYQNLVLLDGNDNSAVLLGGALSFEAQGVKPPVDAVAEFKVITSNVSAEYGYRPGAKVIVSTKSGSNELHGVLYEFFRNEKLDGNNFFANRAGRARPPYRQNQFGGTLGGAIVKNKTFAFGSYQGTRIRLGRNYIVSVPSAAARNGDFSTQPAARRNIFDPLTITGTGATATRLPFAGNRIPQNRFDPVAKAVADVYPLPNIAGRDDLPNNYFNAPSNSDDADQFDIRLDHYFSDRQKIFGRYSRRTQFKNFPGTMPLPADGQAAEFVNLEADNVAIGHSLTIGNNRHNEIRFGWMRFPGDYGIPYTENLNQRFGIRNAPGDSFGDGKDQGWARFNIGGFAGLGTRVNWPNFGALRSYTIGDNFSWQIGRHSIKFGGEYRRYRISRDAQGQRRGFFNLTGDYTSQQPNVGTSRANTGNGMADMLLGMANQITYGNGRGEELIAPYYGAFLQDDFKVSSRLTVNLGVRWELYLNPTFPDPDRQRISRYLTEYNGVSRAEERFVFPTGSGDCGCVNNYRNFGPRAGIAYRLNDKTVVRTGSGLYFGIPSAINEQSPRFFTGPPRYTEINVIRGRETTDLLVRNGFPNFTAGTVPNGVNVDTAPDKQRNINVWQWFFDLQRNLPADVLLTVGYAGSKSSHLDVSRNINQPLTPSATVPANQRFIRPQFNQVILHDSSLNASYQALTAKAERRFSGGYTFLGSFTWSHNIDFIAERQSGTSSPQTDWDLSRERASSDLDRRLSFNFSAVYELPFGKTKPFAKSGAAAAILGGWQVGTVLALLSGTPVDHTFAADNQNTGGRVRGDVVGSPTLDSGQRSIDRWYDTTFLRASAPGVISNAGRNLILAPGKRNIDLLVSRDIALPWESHRVQFRFEAFNLTNTANFGPPNAAVGTPAAGQITVADEPRRLQFALKYSF